MRWEKKKLETSKQSQANTTRSGNEENLYLKDKTDYNRNSITNIAELLHQIGDIPKETIKQAFEEAKKTNKFVGEILVQRGIISHNNLLSLLIKHCRIPLLSIINYNIDKSLLKLLPPEVCEKYGILPLDRIGNNVTIAMVNPLDREALKAAKEHLPNFNIRPVLCSYVEFEKAKKIYFRPSDSLSQLTESTGNSEETFPSQVEVKNIPEPPIVDEPVDETSKIEAERQKSLIHTVFTEPISSEIAITSSEVPQGNISVEQLATSMIESLRGSYQLLVRKIKLFHGLTPEEVAHIFNFSKTKQLKKDEILFHKGDAGYCLYILITGEIEIFDGDTHICYLSPGEMIGEMAVITKNRRSASAKATKNSTLLEVDLNTISRFIPSIVIIKMLTNIIYTLSSRLQQITSKLQPQK